jgi:hypothetical protein
MTIRLEYTVAHQLNALHDELIAAGIAPTYLGDDPDNAPDGLVMDVPDGTDEAAVAAVIAAHDPAAVEAAAAARAQQFAQDVQTVKTFMGTANGTATDAQRDAVFKAFVRVVRRVFRELDG